MNILRKLFFNEASDELQTPFDFFYIKIIRAALKLIRSWPSKEIGEDESKFLSIILSSILTVLTSTHLIGGILYIYMHGKYLTFMELGYAYIISLMDFVIAIHERVYSMSHIFTFVLTIQTFTGVILFNAIPMYNCYVKECYNVNGIRNLTFDISVYLIYPLHTYSSMAEYFLIFIFNCIYSSLAATWFCMFDLFLSIMVFHMWGHFKILLHKLNTIPRPIQRSYGLYYSLEKYSDSELLMVSNSLLDCINYHKLILGFTNKMSETFGTMLFVYYAFHQVSGCLMLLECSQLTTGALIRYLPMTLILYQQLVQLSIIFELIGSTSEKLKHAVYNLPWESMNVKNRKTVLILLMNVQKPIHVKALGIASVGVATMAGILKTSLSYFTFLRSM